MRGMDYSRMLATLHTPLIDKSIYKLTASTFTHVIELIMLTAIRYMKEYRLPEDFIKSEIDCFGKKTCKTLNDISFVISYFSTKPEIEYLRHTYGNRSYRGPVMLFLQENDYTVSELSYLIDNLESVLPHFVIFVITENRGLDEIKPWVLNVQN